MPMRTMPAPKRLEPRLSWRLLTRITVAASTAAAIWKAICGISVLTIPGSATKAGALLSAASIVDYHRWMSTDKTPRFRYRLGLNQPAGSPTVRRIGEMAEAIRGETGGEFLIEVFPESRLGPDPKMFA